MRLAGAISLALAALRKFLHSPSLPANAGNSLLRSPPEAKLRRGRGGRKIETAPFAARLSAAAELGRPARLSRPRVRRTLSPSSGNPPFVLCQCPQKSLLLSRLRPGRRSPSLCPVVPPSILPPMSRLSERSYSRPCRYTRASRHVLSTATPTL